MGKTKNERTIYAPAGLTELLHNRRLHCGYILWDSSGFSKSDGKKGTTKQRYLNITFKIFNKSSTHPNTL
jgi:hypothetical protein